ncbi:transcriptional regulator family: bZIP [Paecilomyces variotii]|nr:transcriptional regulator family: bZIP [Paecilomyces variotii]KAJ9268906.1 transcriptional regulator family: bZIP [Paecilomyces variotii]KAJ9315690.1 transcriptional regulator family: bZIP [Paecilomyces variotii]
MADYNTLYQQNLYLSPGQQDLLLAALHSNNPSQKQDKNAPTDGVQPKREPDTTSPQQPHSNNFTMPPTLFESPGQETIGSGQLGFEESPFLDFDPDVDFDFQGADQLIGDLPESVSPEEQEHREKRKSMDGKSEPEEAGKKRRESDEKSAKKPGRKPLTSEPTSKRKAQNRAAQRAFRERKEKHLKDLETKVESLEKASEATNHENGLLRAQVERLQVELREYRKRLSWITSGNGYSPMQAIQNTHSRNLSGISNNDFYFDFPKFGDLPGAHIFNNGSLAKANPNVAKENGSAAGPASEFRAAPGVLGRDSLGSASISGASPKFGSPAQPSTAPAKTATDNVNGVRRTGNNSSMNMKGTYASGAVRSNNPAASTAAPKQNTVGSQGQAPVSSTVSNSDSPYSSSESHQGRLLSSGGTSPEPGSNSPPVGKLNEQGQPTEDQCGTIDGEKSFCEKLGLACGNIKNPIPPAMNGTNRLSRTPGQSQPSKDQQPLGLDWLSQQNGGQFDPVLFGDYRDPQEAILSQDFGNFFNDAFPLPDLGSPFHNFPDVTSPPALGPKKDLISDIDNKLDDDDEVVPGEDKSQMMTCTKIWDRLQSMEKFRSGEIDVDSLCTELRTKARCSEGGVVVNQRDVEDIMGRVN